MSKTKIIIFDIDGTLANNDHRTHYVERPADQKKDWEAFHAAAVDDVPHEPLKMLTHTLSGRHKIYLMTGRGEEYRALTEKWLADNHIFYDRLHMRRVGDRTPDHEVKRAWLKNLRNCGFDVVMAFEDRKSVVDMWRAEGVFCCQVAEGNF